MNRRVIAVGLLLLGAMCTSLWAGGDATRTEAAPEPAAVNPYADYRPGTYLSPVNRLRAYQLSELPADEVQDGVEWAASFEGAVLGLLDQLEFDGEIRKAINADLASRPVQEFARVRVPSLENQEVWMSLQYMVPGGVPAALNALTPEFLLPLQQAPGYRSFNRGTVVLVHPDSVGDGGKFARVTGWDEEQGIAILGALVANSNLTSEDDDVATAVRIKTLQYNPLVSDEQRLELLARPLSTGGNPEESEFAQEFLDYRKSLGYEDPAAAQASTEVPFHTEALFFETTGTITDPIVNVRSAPSTEAEVVGQLEQGDAVTMDAQTYLKYEVSGFADYWYRITSPVQGWVFGVLIE